jgi:hypothetical protein
MKQTALKLAKKDLTVFLLLAILSLAMTYPLLFHMGDHVPSDLRDPLYTIWVLAWDVRAAGSGFSQFADANIFYPHRDTLYYADSLPALAVLGSPFMALGLSPVLAYNILFILSFFFCGLGMYLLVRHLTLSRTAAFMAGLIFAFFPYRFAHISHLELLYFAWMPLCLLFIHRFFEEPTVRNTLGIAFFYLLQVTSCSYYGEYLTLFAGLLVLYLALKHGYWRKGFFWSRMALLAVLCLAVLFPYFYPYFKLHARMLFSRPVWEVKFYSAELQHFLAVPAWNVAWGWLTGKLGAQEWQLCPGVFPVLLTLAWWLGIKKAWRETPPKTGAKRRWFFGWDVFNILLLIFVAVIGVTGGFEGRLAGIGLSVHQLKNPVLILLISLILRILLGKNLRSGWLRFFRAASPPQKYYLLVAVLAWLLSLGPVVKLLGREIIGGLYGLFYSWMPGFQNLRVPSRFAVLMMLGLAVLSGWGVLFLMEKWKRPRLRTIGPGILALLVLADYASVPMHLAKVNVGSQIPKIYAAVRKLPKEASLVELPMPAHDWEEFEEAAAVYYSIYHWRNIVNGYSGYAPPGYRVIREAMDEFPSESTFELLNNLEVGYLLVHTQGFRPEKGRDIVRRLRNFMSRVELVVQTDGDFLIRLLPAAPKTPEDGRLVDVGDRTKWKADASLNRNLVELAFDGDPNTGWSTGYPQRQGDYFRLDLGSPVHMRRVELVLNNNPLDFPRSFIVEGSLDGRQWTKLNENPSFFPPLNLRMIEDFSQYKVDVRFEPCQVRYLRLTLTRSHEARHWSINEIVCKN